MSMQYEVDITRKTTYRIRVEASDRPEAITQAVEQYKKGDEGIIQKDVVDVSRVERIIT